MKYDMAGMRGTSILLYPPVEPKGVCLDFSFEDCREQLRFYLMYFDRLCAVPLNIFENSIFGVSYSDSAYLMSEDLQILVQQGVVEKFPFVDRVIKFQHQNEPILAVDLSSVYHHANKNWSPGWALARPKYLVSDVETEKSNAIILTFRNLFPSPRRDVSISDIIAFRSENRDLLNNLMYGVDKLFVSLGGNLDLISHEIEQVLKKIENALEQSKILFDKVDFSVTRAISSELISPIVALLAECVGIGWVVRILSGSISVESRKSSNAIISNAYPSDFEYVYLGRQKIPADYEVKSQNGHMVTGIYMDENSFRSGFIDEIVPERSYAFQSVPAVSGNIF